MGLHDCVADTEIQINNIDIIIYIVYTSHRHIYWFLYVRILWWILSIGQNKCQTNPKIELGPIAPSPVTVKLGSLRCM